MRKLHQSGWDVADFLIAGLAKVGYLPDPRDRVLDFGCGEGGLVYRFVDLGFEARGFDIHNYVKLREPSDAALFRFIENPITDTSDTTFDGSQFRIPFNDGIFDFVVSTSTLEHVTSMAPVMSEIARVLKPNGVALHLYPGRNAIIEPHVLVPLGGRVQSWWWFYLWGLLGIRSPYQKHLDARAFADSCLRYARTGLRYWSEPDLFSHAMEHFAVVEHATELFHASPSTTRDNLRKIWQALKGRNMLGDLATIPRHKCLVTAQKREVVAIAPALEAPAVMQDLAGQRRARNG